MERACQQVALLDAKALELSRKDKTQLTAWRRWRIRQSNKVLGILSRLPRAPESVEYLADSQYNIFNDVQVSHDSSSGSCAHAVGFQ